MHKIVTLAYLLWDKLHHILAPYFLHDCQYGVCLLVVVDKLKNTFAFLLFDYFHELVDPNVNQFFTFSFS